MGESDANPWRVNDGEVRRAGCSARGRWRLATVTGGTIPPQPKMVAACRDPMPSRAMGPPTTRFVQGAAVPWTVEPLTKFVPGDRQRGSPLRPRPQSTAKAAAMAGAGLLIDEVESVLGFHAAGRGVRRASPASFPRWAKVGRRQSREAGQRSLRCQNVSCARRRSTGRSSRADGKFVPVTVSVKLRRLRRSRWSAETLQGDCAARGYADREI